MTIGSIAAEMQGMWNEVRACCPMWGVVFSPEMGYETWLVSCDDEELIGMEVHRLL